MTNDAPDDGRVSLVHGDYRLDNMIFMPDRSKVAAVLDWELSTLGHPLADLAYQCMQWRLPSSSGFKGLGGVDRLDAVVPVHAHFDHVGGLAALRAAREAQELRHRPCPRRARAGGRARPR